MPARRDYTPDELLAWIAKQREQARLRMARLRERQKRYAHGVRVTNSQEGTPSMAGDGNLPQTPSSLSISKEIEKIGRILAPFASRGYDHNPEFWADMAGAYPDVRLVVEAYGMASWLRTPKKVNQSRKCSEEFIGRWLKKAQRDATAPPTNGGQPAAPVDATPGGVRNPGPAPLLPDGEAIEMVDRAHAQRALFDAKKLNLAEKLALARNGTNGRAHR